MSAWNLDKVDFKIFMGVKVVRFIRVCFGLVSSMYHLEATIDYHLMNYSESNPSIPHETLTKFKVHFTQKIKENGS